MIEATDADTGNKRPVTCPTCHADLSIADGLDIGYLQCDRDEKHQWTLHTALAKNAGYPQGKA